MTKEEKQRGLELQGYADSIKDMTLGEIAIKYLKKHHLPRFMYLLLVKFSHPLLLIKDYRIDELEKEVTELKAQLSQWHYVKDELPLNRYDRVGVTVAYLNAYENPCKMDCFYDGTDFVYWDSGKNVGWKKADIYGKIYAWKYADEFIPKFEE